MQDRPFRAGMLVLGCLACSADPARPPPPFESQGGSVFVGGPTLGIGGTATGVGVGVGMPIPITDEPGVDLGAACDETRGVASDSEALLVRDPEILARFSLERVLTRVIETAGASIAPLELLQRLFDTENTKASGAFADNVHCDDPNNPAFAGVPFVECPRAEGRLALSDGLLQPEHPDGFVPVALVNRFDLATSDFSTCGEYHIVFAKASGRTDPADRALLSFQAALRNPEGAPATCRPVAELWAGLLETDDIAARADALERFFFQGIEGFQAVVAADYFMSLGRLQLGQGLQAPWQFRQFRLWRPAPGPEIAFSPVRVTGSIRPELFDPDVPDPDGSHFRSELPAQARAFKTLELPRLRWFPGSGFEAGESSVEGPSAPNYLARVQSSQSGAQLLSTLAEAIDPTDADRCPPDDPLNAEALLQRASALSCAGCHAPERIIVPAREIGCGQAWPESLGEAHINELGELSRALREVFLPDRAWVLSEYLKACDVGAVADYFHYVPPFEGPFPECFPAGTPITLADGSLKPIEQVEPGEWVLTFELATHSLVPAPVERRIIRRRAERLVLINGSLLATDNHPFYSDGRWVRAEALEVGASLLAARDVDPTSTLQLALEKVPVSSLSVQPGAATTYNLEVALHHSYFAGGLLVHDRP